MRNLHQKTGSLHNQEVAVLSRSGGTGRRSRLKICRGSLPVWVRLPPPGLSPFEIPAIEEICDFRGFLKGRVAERCTTKDAKMSFWGSTRSTGYSAIRNSRWERVYTSFCFNQLEACGSRARVGTKTTVWDAGRLAVSQVALAGIKRLSLHQTPDQQRGAPPSPLPPQVPRCEPCGAK